MLEGEELDHNAYFTGNYRHPTKRTVVRRKYRRTAYPSLNPQDSFLQEDEEDAKSLATAINKLAGVIVDIALGFLRAAKGCFTRDDGYAEVQTFSSRGDIGASRVSLSIKMPQSL